MTHNTPRLGEVGELEVQMFNIALQPPFRQTAVCALNGKYKSFLEEIEEKTQRVQVPYSLG